MDLWDVVKLLCRRWVLFVPLLLLTLGIGIFLSRTVPPDYRATGHLMLLPPSSEVTQPGTSTDSLGPWNVSTLADALVIYSYRDELRETLAQQGLPTEWSTEVLANDSKVIRVTVTATDSREAQEALKRLINVLIEEVALLQQPYIKPGGKTVAAQAVDLKGNVEVNTSRVKRVLIVAIAISILLTMTTTILFDVLRRHRAWKRSRGQKGTERHPDGSKTLATALYEFYELDARIEHHADAEDGPIAALHSYYDPILKCIDPATADVDHVFNLLGPPPEPMGTVRDPGPRTPIGSAS